MSVKKPVFGVGINDVDYKVTKNGFFLNKNGDYKHGQLWICPFYRVWKKMLERGYSQAYKLTRPTYNTVTVCDEWLTFSNFKAWMEVQDWEGKELDKDILVRGNKIYSPDTSAFVTRTVNLFVTEKASIDRPWPIGVQQCPFTKKFMAGVHNPFTSKKEHLGSFTWPHEAHEAWLKRKLELATLLAKEQKDIRVAKAIISRYENYNEEI